MVNGKMTSRKMSLTPDGLRPVDTAPACDVTAPVSARVPTSVAAFPGRVRSGRSLPLALARAREHVSAPMRPVLGAVGISEQQWRILTTLETQGACDSGSLASATCLHLPSITRLTRGLSERGMVELFRDSQDRRRHMIRISDKGSAMVARHLAVCDRMAAQLCDGMGAQNYETLIDLLEALVAVPQNPTSGV